MRKLRVGSLFSGFGGLDLGLERAGFDIAWMCEIKEYARKILAQSFPGIPIYEDITKITQVPYVDVLAGGFPCQDISNAGTKEGLNGTRSGLWREYNRVIGLVRPRYVIVENVPALTGRGLSTVLADLTKVGYDAEWEVVPASAFGAPHKRERILIVAYPTGDSMEEPILGALPGRPSLEFGRIRWGDVPGTRWEADQPSMVGVVHGISRWMERVEGLGNAVVPDVAEWVGRQILRREGVLV